MDDEKQAVRQPLLADYQADPEGAPGKAEPPLDITPPSSAKITKFRIKSIVLVALWLSFSWYLYRKWEFMFDEHEYPHLSTLLDDEDHEHPHVSCDTFNLTNIFAGSNSTSGSFNLSSTADHIKIFSRGFIYGNVTLESGTTEGDDIEVDVTLDKPWWWGKHHHHCHKHKNGTNSTWPPSWKPGHHRRHHRPPPPTTIKVCPFYKEDGSLSGLGLFAFNERHHHPPGHHGDHPHPGPPHHEHPHPHPHPPHHPPHRGPPDHDEPTWSTFSDLDYKFQSTKRKSWWKVLDKHHPKPPKAPKRPKKPHSPGAPPPRAIHASIAIKFPSSAKDVKDLEIKSFESGLFSFKHYIKDLDVTFDRLSIVGGVASEGVSAANLKVVSFHGITGKYSASNILELVAPGGPIDVNAELLSDASDTPVKPTTFVAVTTNHALHANISLTTYADSLKDTPFPPAYFVKTSSINADSILQVTSQPVNSSLTASVYSKGAPAYVYLPTTFEGEIQLSSIFSKPVFIVASDPDDPAGEGRKRVVSIKKTWMPWIFRASVAWVKQGFMGGVHVSKGGCAHSKEGPKGVKVTTVKAPASVILE